MISPKYFIENNSPFKRFSGEFFGGCFFLGGGGQILKKLILITVVHVHVGSLPQRALTTGLSIDSFPHDMVSDEKRQL